MSIDKFLCVCNSLCQSEYVNTDFISNIVLGTTKNQSHTHTKTI